MNLRFLPLVCLSLAALFPGRAQIVSAGDLLVNLDFTAAADGPLPSVANAGTLGGVFETKGLAAAEIPRIARPGGAGGTAALFFDGVDQMQHLVASGGAVFIPPAGITGVNPTRSIEVWVFNPTLQDEETMVAWGRRGGANGNNMSFNYGTSGAYGAVGHWGGADIGWNNAGGAPAAGVWHHLAYTFDGGATRVYVDGVPANSEVTTVDTLPLPPITLAAQNTSDAGALDGGLRGALALARVRIHDGVLTDADISQNYNTEAPAFTIGPASPLSVRPRHRYSFNNPANASATGAVIEDREGAADGVVLGAGASFNGTHLVLAGGGSGTQGYVDLPNRIISTNAAVNGGSGRITVEGWITLRGTRAWGRIFDFGSSTTGEATGPGGSGNGADYFMLTAHVNTDITRKLLEITNNDAAGSPTAGGPTGARNTTVESSGLNVPMHFAVTWDESTGQVTYYENGFLVSDLVVDRRLDHLNDINVWLGRSNWYGDQNIQADYDEIRIYGEVLSAGEIRNNFLHGPDTLFVDPGPLQSVALQIPHPAPFVNTWQRPRLLADFQNVQDVDVTAEAGAVFLSTDPGVVAVTAQKELRAAGLGTADIQGVYGGVTSTVSVTVAPESAVLEHRYSFSGNADDSVGGAHGSVFGAAVFTNGTVSLAAATLDHVRLPAGIIAGDYAVTVEAWADIRTSGNWARLFDFGDTNPGGAGRNYILYSPRSATGGQRLAISNTDPGFTLEGQVNLPTSLENRGPTHIVCVVHPAGRRTELYLNGALAGVNTNITQTLAGVTDTLNYLGRSLYNGDAYLNGSIDEFRIHDGVLTPRRVALGLAAGPGALPPAEEGAPVGVNLACPSSLALFQTADATLFGDFENITGVNLELTHVPAYASSDTSVATVGPTGIITPIRPGTTEISGTFGGFTSAVTLTVVRTIPLDLAHRYPFDGNCDDVIGGAHAVLRNQNGNAAYAAGQLLLGNAGNEPSSGAAGNFVDLPNGLLSALGPNATLELWTTWDNSAGTRWQRSFDLGRSNGGEGVSDNGANHEYLFHSPRSGDGDGFQVLGLNRYTTVREERRVTGPGPAPAGVPLHIVMVFDAAGGFLRLYQDGGLVGQVALHAALSEFEDVNNWLGRSQFGGDAYYAGSYDELRLYRGVMSSGDVADSFAAGPAGGAFIAPAVSVSAAGLGQGRVSWPAALTGYVLQHSDGLPGGWIDSPAPVVTEGAEKVVYDTPAGPHRVYRLRKVP